MGTVPGASSKPRQPEPCGIQVCCACGVHFSASGVRTKEYEPRDIGGNHEGVARVMHPRRPVARQLQVRLQRDYVQR